MRVIRDIPPNRLGGGLSALVIGGILAVLTGACAAAPPRSGSSGPDPDRLARLDAALESYVESQLDACTLPKVGARLVQECRETVSAVLPLETNEHAFLDLLLEEGRIEPSLLTPDAALQERIRVHPLLQWKALNVRRRKDLP